MLSLFKKEHLIPLFLIVLLGFAFAYGTTNPTVFGHSGGEIHVDDGGTATPLDTFVSSVRSDITTLQTDTLRNCNWISQVTNSPLFTVSCPAGKILMGGGCNPQGGELQDTYPNGNTWQCYAWGAPTGNRAYALCCDA